MEYGSIVWDNCDDECKNILDKIELEAARVVTGGIKGTHHQALYDEGGWKNLRSRKEQHKLFLYHKMIHHKAPEYLYNLVPSMVRTIHGYNTRQSEQTDYKLPSCRLELYQTSFPTDSVRLWNHIHNDMKRTNNFNIFKKMMQKQTSKKTNKMYYYGNRHNNPIHARLQMNYSQR